MVSQELAILAALLHDIGKFSQRAGHGSSKELADMYCPQDKGRDTHKHVLYSDYFIENDLPLPPQLEGQRSKLARLAASHHKPANELLEKTLQRADCLSSGADRKGGEESTGDYKSARLLTIFEQVSLNGERPYQELADGRYHPLTPLSSATAPVALEQARTTTYTELFRQFTEQLQTLPLDMGTGAYIQSLTSLLEEYTWCIPSSTYKSLPDISLYDHAVTTAALTQALLRHAETTGIGPGEQIAEAEKFMLVGGDLSGIQNYIFNLDHSHGRGVAKLFRARSFYLQALTRGVILSLCKKLKLSPLARVMDAGGRFLLLVPALDENRTILAEFEQELQQQMFERFQGRLSLNLDWSVAMTEEDLDMTKFPGFLDQANDALEQRKLCKFDRLFASGQETVIPLDFSAYENGDCSICHCHPAEIGSIDDVQADHSEKICRECQDQIERIGSELPKCKYLVFEKERHNGSVELLFGLHLRLEERIISKRDSKSVELVAIQQRGQYSYQPIAAHLPTITEADIEQWQYQNELTEVAGQLFYGEDTVSTGEAKTFSLLARSARRVAADGNPVGRSFLGAFKADVDNLGLVFSIGLQNRLSLSRFASLSRMLNHFFSDDLVRWIKDKWPDLYIIFAGGDDLFLLGPWRQLVDFSGQLQQRFNAWVSKRPDLTLSAGISIHKPGLPVHAIAEQAEAALEASKHYNQGDQLKNAATLFETTVTWDEFHMLKKQGDKFLQWLDNEIITRGLIARLLEYGNMQQRFASGQDIKAGLYRSHMCYDFARNVDEKKVPDPATRAEVLGIQLNDKLLGNIRLPVSYALYQTRHDH